jgi:hypothetical protein
MTFGKNGLLSLVGAGPCLNGQRDHRMALTQYFNVDQVVLKITSTHDLAAGYVLCYIQSARPCGPTKHRGSPRISGLGSALCMSRPVRRPVTLKMKMAPSLRGRTFIEDFSIQDVLGGAQK